MQEENLVVQEEHPQITLTMFWVGLNTLLWDRF